MLTAWGGSDGDPLKSTSFNSFTDLDLPDAQGALTPFNNLCIPPYTASGDVDLALLTDAINICVKRRAMLLIDPPSNWTDKDTAKGEFPGAFPGIVGEAARNAALFFPRITKFNSLTKTLEDFVPCGTIAGIFARTDATRGVWKAPAGIDATLNGSADLSVKLNDPENGELNPLGLNCLRSFPSIGRVAWGSRTVRGSDIVADDYKYIPVRRTALYIEETLYQALKWVVFEPNDEPLWSQIRLNVGAFMQDLFRKGAFQGKTPDQAYFVKCGSDTTTQNDVDLGIVNIKVGFAPLKPAEFVVIQLEQLAGQIQV